MVVCHLLPETIFGYDTDEIFAYTTQKSVWIRDRWVGFGFYCLLSLICMWVVFGQILWRNEHFQLKDAQGVPRLWFSHPTVDNCDPNDGNCGSKWTPASQIPYCQQFSGNAGKSQRPAECIYADKRSMMGLEPAGTENRVFIPTQTITFTEKSECVPSAENGYACSSEYEKVDHPGIKYFDTSVIRYYADVENVRLQFTSSYHRDNIAGTSLEHKASIEECTEKPSQKERSWHARIASEHNQCLKKMRPFRCQKGHSCEKVNVEKPDVLESVGVDTKFLVTDSQLLRSPRSPRSMRGLLPKAARTVQALQVEGGRGLNASRAGALGSGDSESASAAEKDGFWSTDWGDVFLLSKILELAGVNLDLDFNLDDLTTRQAGTVIEIEAFYSNLRPILSSFGYSPVRYYYKVRERPMPYVAREMLSLTQPSDYPNTRTYEVQHGVLIVFSVSGTFGFFNIVYFLIMLTVATGLLGVATKVTDILSIYVHPRRRNYFHLKYEVSPDFSDMWECKICGYFNHEKHEACEGVERWCSPEDEHTRPCGAKRGALPGEAPAAAEG